MPKYIRCVTGDGDEFIVEAKTRDEMTPEERVEHDRLQEEAKGYIEVALPYRSFDEFCDALGGEIHELVVDGVH